MSKDDSVEEKIPTSGPVKWITATVVGLGTGAAKFVTDVRREFFDNLSKSDHAETALREHKAALVKLRSNRRDLGKNNGTEEFIRNWSAEKNSYFRKIDELSEELGIKSKGLSGYTEGSIQRFRMLSENTKVPVAFNAIATTVIGFAGTVMLANSLSSRNHMKHVEEALKRKEKEQKQSRS